MEIQSDRLYYRLLTVDDVSEAYVTWLNDPEVTYFLELARDKQDKASIHAFIESLQKKNNEFLFGIFLKENGLHIGNIKLGPIHPYHRVADLGFLIGERSAWGKGYASEAIAAISRHAFSHLNVNKIHAGLYTSNVGSARALEKAGFQKEGHRVKHYLLHGVPEDIIEYGAWCGNYPTNSL
jgi:RimJ/RimL family protein N-acetyltransferase